MCDLAVALSAWTSPKHNVSLNNYSDSTGSSGRPFFLPIHKDCLTAIPELIKKRAIDRPRPGCETAKNLAALAEPGIRLGQFGMR